MRAETESIYVYLFFIVMIGLIFIVVISNNITALYSPTGRSLELATTIGVHIDSLSSVKDGMLTINTGDYKYDVELQKKDSVLRTLGKPLTNLISKNIILANGWYVVVTPYGDKDKKGDPQYFMVSSYGLLLDEASYHTAITKVSYICVKKTASDTLAKVVACAK
jgi:hypothetical protein